MIQNLESLIDHSIVLISIGYQDDKKSKEFDQPFDLDTINQISTASILKNKNKNPKILINPSID
jgi:hypothetical protein